MCSTQRKHHKKTRGDTVDNGRGESTKEPYKKEPHIRGAYHRRPALLTLVFLVLASASSLFRSTSTANSVSNVDLEGPIQATDTTTISSDASYPTTTPTIYYCGYDDNPSTDLYSLLFPEHAAQAQNAIVVQGHRKARLEDAVEIFNQTHASAKDVLVISEWGCNRLKANFLRVNFPGKVIRFDAEGLARLPHIPKWPKELPPRQYMLGYAADNACKRTTRLTCLAQHLNRHPELWPSVLDPTKKPRSTKQKFLVYAHTNCVSFREQAFDMIAQAFSHQTVEYAGRCAGKDMQIPNKLAVTDRTGHELHKSNYNWMGQYKFCLVMENNLLDGYITEKILNAFASGCIPVYYGSEMVLEIFNPKAFIYYDISNPQPALDKMEQLENNPAAYTEVMKEPILKKGDSTIDEYLALSDKMLHNSTLKRRLRELLLSNEETTC